MRVEERRCCAVVGLLLTPVVNWPGKGCGWLLAAFWFNWDVLVCDSLRGIDRWEEPKTTQDVVGSETGMSQRRDVVRDIGKNAAKQNMGAFIAVICD